MDDELVKRLVELEQKVDRIWKSVERTRKLNLWKSVIYVVIFVLPLIGLAFVIPKFLHSFNINDYLNSSALK